ncbi:MAG: carbonate dehydratase [Micavibrio aeruginosavorus]|nr:carbonate dehydratase [Micavibrio aeruginosavorus]
MTRIQDLFENNKAWSKRQMESDPDFFNRLTTLQKPKFLWIGCSDSRVPANQILGLKPGEVFVHRNVANLVVHSDLNCLSVLQYAVEVLQVEHIIVCGHYGCGGIGAACSNQQFGLIDNWLRSIKDTYDRYRSEIEAIPDQASRHDRMCELNVLTQVMNVCHTTIVQNAWARGQKLEVHGLVYRLTDGLLHDLAVHITSLDQIEDIYKLGRLDRRKTDAAAG